MRQRETVSALLAVYAICMLGEGLLDVLIVPWVSQQMGGDALTFGWMMSAQAMGSIAGGVIIGMAGKTSSARWLLTLGSAGWGLIDLAIFNSRSLPLALALFALVGLPIAGLMVSVQTLLQQEVPDEFRGRAFGALATTGALTTLVGMGLSSGLADRAGVLTMLNLACATVLVGTALAWLRLVRRPAAGQPMPG